MDFFFYLFSEDTVEGLGVSFGAVIIQPGWYAGSDPRELLLGVCPCRTEPVTGQVKGSVADGIAGCKENTAAWSGELLCAKAF